MLPRTRRPGAVATSVLFSFIALWSHLTYAADESRKLTAATADALERGFAQPPLSARPHTWWYWMNGYVTNEGITADLEAMKRAGIAGPQMFTVQQSMRGPDGQPLKGDVVFLSPTWRERVKHAARECQRLGLEMSILNCEGWGEGGGQSVTQAESMQKVVWSQQQIQGGDRTKLGLPRPVPLPDYYQDIALLAFPTPPGDDQDIVPSISVSAQAPIAKSRPPESAPPLFTMPFPMPGAPQWVLLDYGQPRAFRSLYIAINEMRDIADPERWENSPYLDAADKKALSAVPGPHYWELQASDDGKTFRAVGRVSTHGTTSFPETTARFFRVWMPVPPPLQKQLPLAPTERVELTEIKLGGPRIDRPEMRAGKYIDWTIREFSGGRVPSQSVIPKDRIVNLTDKSEWQAPPGSWTLLRIGHASSGMTISAAAEGGLEADKLSRTAVWNQLSQGMDGVVLSDVGALAGTTVKNIVCDSWERGYENWTPLMREEFIQRRGYDPGPWLPAITGLVVESVEASERFLWDFRRTLADLVAQNYYGTLQEFAHAHNMRVYAEATGHGMPAIADQLQCKGRTDVPMGEFWAGRGDSDDAKEAGSAAHIYGQNKAAAESFTAARGYAGWSRDPSQFKIEGDFRFCFGINRFCLQCFAHQPWLDRQPGMTIGQYGSNFERTNTWWPLAGSWISYVSRCQFLLQQGRFVAEVCYFYGEDAPVDFRFDRMDPKLPAGFDFDVCNADIVMQMRMENGRLTLPSGMSYRVLVLPKNERMTPRVLHAIQSLVRAGATVVGPKPRSSPSLAGYPECDRDVQSTAEEMWGDCDGRAVKEHAYGQGWIKWGQPLAEVLATPPDFATDDPRLHFIHRRDGATEIYFISNQSDRPTTADCTFRVKNLMPELWQPDTGARGVLPAFVQKKEGTRLTLSLAAGGSVFVIFRAPSSAIDPVVAVSSPKSAVRPATELAALKTAPSSYAVAADGAITVTMSEAGDFTWTTASGKVYRPNVPAVPASRPLTGPWQIQFPPRLGAPESATFSKLMSWTESTDEGIKYFSGTAEYQTSFTLSTDEIGKGTRCFLDLGEVKNLCEVFVNGSPVGVLWTPPFGVDVTEAIQPGSNRLTVKVTNLWPNRLIGDQRLPLEQRITWASYQHYTADSPLFPSGLLGPVSLRFSKTVRLEP